MTDASTTPHIETVFAAPGPHPNGMQAVNDGLWIIDQQTNQLQLVDWTGEVLLTLETAADRGSGVTDDGDVLWIASTYDCRILRVDRATGATLASFPSPGAAATGAHGLEFHGGLLWIASPPSATIYQVAVTDEFRAVHQIPAPGNRPHGLAWRGEELWCIETNQRTLYRLDPTGGALLHSVVIPPSAPEPHGMTWWQDAFWYCDANTRAVCRLTLP